eukprot:scaffold141812_cov63-Attheya_sp.AAC.3
MAIGTISSAQATGTKATAKAVAHLLDYCAMYPEASIKYTASDMIPRIHSVTRPTYLKLLRAVVPAASSTWDTITSTTLHPLTVRFTYCVASSATLCPFQLKPNAELSFSTPKKVKCNG